MKAHQLKTGQIFSFCNSPKKWFVVGVRRSYIVVYQFINNTVTFKQMVISQNTLNKKVIIS